MDGCLEERCKYCGNIMRQIDEDIHLFLQYNTFVCRNERCQALCVETLTVSGERELSWNGGKLYDDNNR